MAKRMKTVRAGRLVRSVIYTALNPRDPDHVRAAKSKCSTKARQRMNLKRSAIKLKLMIAANFTFSDLVVTYTYDDSSLPLTVEAAEELLKNHLVKLRAHRKKRGEIVKSIYVTESKHGDGRIHHHRVLNGTGADLDTLQSLWPWGNIEIELIEARGYTALAEYLTKEPREVGSANGKRTWIPTLNLVKPKEENEWVPDHVTLAAPPGATVLDNEKYQNEFGSYAFIEYLLPDIPVRKGRPKQQPKRQ